MKIFMQTSVYLFVAGLLLATLGFQGAASASTDTNTLQGRWILSDGSAVIDVTPGEDDETLTGTIVGLLRHTFSPIDGYGSPGTPRVDINNPDASLKQRSVIGLEIMPELVANGDHWRGHIYDPRTGRSYRCVISMEGNDLVHIRAYVGPSLFGRSMYWQRLDSFRDEMQALLANVA